MRSKPNLSTREGREAEILDRIREYDGVTVFWVTDNQKRAHAMDRLETSGRVIRQGGSFPWMTYIIKDDYEVQEETGGR